MGNLWRSVSYIMVPTARLKTDPSRRSYISALETGSQSTGQRSSALDHHEPVTNWLDPVEAQAYMILAGLVMGIWSSVRATSRT